jgi:arylsulfatase
MNRRYWFWAILIAVMIVPFGILFEVLHELQRVVQIRKPCILLITIDTCRYDVLGMYGNPDVYASTCDLISRHGVLFTKGYAPIPTTAPSHISLLTGKDPGEHHVFRNGMHYEGSSPPLPEILTGVGYQTAAFISGYSLINRMTGIGRGFQFFDDSWSQTQVERDCEATTRSFIEWLGKHQNFPFFAWIHYFDPHSPYQPGSVYAKMTSATTKIPEALAVADEKRVRYENNVKNALAAGDFGVLVKDPATTQTDPEILDSNWSLYEGEVSHVDRSIFQVIEELENCDLLDRTLLVLTSDHGEGFDHDYYYAHGDRLWESAVRVPWMIRYPKDANASRIVAQQALHKDLVPTILSFIGFQYELPGSSGENLNFLMSTKLPRREITWFACAPPLPRKALSEGLLLSAYDPRYKLIRNETSKKATLYDLNSDPAETQDISEQNEKTAYRLGVRLDQYKLNGGFPESAELPGVNSDDAEKLKQLGYAE